jgi:large subunit ribosomal protein L3
MYHRRVGSNGANTHPARVFKGKKLPGHMGNENVTIQNLNVVRVDIDKKVILIKGAVPGPKGGLLMIKNTVKKA